MSISRVQLAGNSLVTGAGGGSVSVTVAATKKGNLIVAQLNASNGQVSTLGISDNKGNVYTQYPGVFVPTNIWTGNHNSNDALWFTIDQFGGVTSVSMSCTAATATLTGVVGEYFSTNGWPANPTDKTSGSKDASSANWTSIATATTSQPSELLWGTVIFAGANAPVTPAGGWGVGLDQVLSASTTHLFNDDQVVSVSAAYAFSGTFANSGEYGTAIATFKDISGSILAAGQGSWGGKMEARPASPIVDG